MYQGDMARSEREESVRSVQCSVELVQPNTHENIHPQRVHEVKEVQNYAHES
jgi:hypothetical protein